jgi:hypothetical protein
MHSTLSASRNHGHGVKKIVTSVAGEVGSGKLQKGRANSTTLDLNRMAAITKPCINSCCSRCSASDIVALAPELQQSLMIFRVCCNSNFQHYLLPALKLSRLLQSFVIPSAVSCNMRDLVAACRITMSLRKSADQGRVPANQHGPKTTRR